MAKFVPKVFPDILQRMINRVVARTALSDLTDTSVFKTILAAVAREIDDVYFQINNKLDVFNIDRASGDDLDRRAEDYNPILISRKLAIASTGNVVFTRTTPNPGPIINIPLGTEIEVPGEPDPIVAITSAAGTIPVSASSSAPVPAVISEAAERGNVGALQLTKFRGAKPSGVDAVSNPSAFVGGQDKELDDAFRQRIKDKVRSAARSTPIALETAALETEIVATGQTVLFASTVESLINLGFVTLYIDDGTGNAETTDATVSENLTSGIEFPGDVAQGGEVFLNTDNKAIKDSITPVVVKNPGAVTLIRNDAGGDGYTLNAPAGQLRLNTALTAGDDVAMSYTFFTGLIALVQKVIDGDPTDRVNFPGVRAAGVLVQVLVPTVRNITFDIGIVVLDGFDLTVTAQAVRDEVATYVNKLGIGNDIILAEVIERSMSVPGMFDISIIAPLANVVILDNELPRINNAATDIVIN